MFHHETETKYVQLNFGDAYVVPSILAFISKLCFLSHRSINRRLINRQNHLVLFTKWSWKLIKSVTTLSVKSSAKKKNQKKYFEFVNEFGCERHSSDLLIVKHLITAQAFGIHRNDTKSPLDVQYILVPCQPASSSSSNNVYRRLSNTQLTHASTNVFIPSLSRHCFCPLLAGIRVVRFNFDVAAKTWIKSVQWIFGLFCRRRFHTMALVSSQSSSSLTSITENRLRSKDSISSKTK